MARVYDAPRKHHDTAALLSREARASSCAGVQRLLANINELEVQIKGLQTRVDMPEYVRVVKLF